MKTVKYYCDICGNEGGGSEYSLPLDETAILHSSTIDKNFILKSEKLCPFKMHLCKHCALRIRNFIENEMIPHDKTYDEFLVDIYRRER